ncbi:MAG: radical SAM protein, partial [Candidatus Krumholzibacteria bacterium]|nr:radical SAM protein [Candidatus Krumholzibacteria bacterium]
TSRGCPFNCSFCSVTAFNGKKYRFRSPGLVLDELATIPQKYIFFVDDNLVGNTKRSFDRAKLIFRGMVERKLERQYMAQVTINFGSDIELIELAAASGCRAVFIGIESIVEGVLESMNKKVNIAHGITGYRKTIRRIQHRGIAVIGTIAVGNDGEPSHIFKDTARFVDKSGLDAVQFTIITPLPGTTLFEQLAAEERIVFDNYPEDWVHYSLGSLVFHPKDRSPEEIAAGWKLMIDRVYSKAAMRKRFFYSLFRTKRFSAAYFSYKLNKAYRQAYLDSGFYSDPPLEAFHLHRWRRKREEFGIGSRSLVSNREPAAISIIERQK